MQADLVIAFPPAVGLLEADCGPLGSMTRPRDRILLPAHFFSAQNPPHLRFIQGMFPLPGVLAFLLKRASAGHAECGTALPSAASGSTEVQSS